MEKKSFLRDLARGGNAETLVIELFAAAGFPSHADKKARSEWDVKSTYDEPFFFTTEVKYDEYENRSGNIAMEVYNPHTNKPSGLTATKAFFWAHVLVGKVVWLITTNELKAYIDKNPPSHMIDRGGDNNATLWLYPSNNILPRAFTRIDTMTNEELRSFVHTQLKEG